MVVVLTSKAIPSLRMTVDEFLEADFPEGFRYELVDGEVIMSPQPNLPHDLVVDGLTVLLTEYRKQHKGRIRLLSLNARVSIPGAETVRHPDFALYAPWKGSPESDEGWKRIIPFLVIEVVSKRQAKRDYQEKRLDYWKARIGEYWIVDPGAETLTVLRRGRSRWLHRTYSASESFDAACLPGLRIDVGSVLEPVL